MPLSLRPFSRRRFLAGSVAGATALTLRRPAFAATPADPDRFALLSDTHVDADPSRINRETNMYANLRRVCEQLTALETRPAAVLIDGDLAHNTGEAADYVTLLTLLNPVREKGMPIHCSLGNHDHRERFRQAVSWMDGRVNDVVDRQLTVIESPKANWFILDSLDKTNSTPGTLGEAQLKWLSIALDARKAKPALVMVHHDPELTKRQRPSGLLDTAALVELLSPRKHVKALFYGHTHTWKITEKDGIHLVNLPPTAYTFNATMPNGWVECRLADGAMSLQLHALDDRHAEHKRKIELAWR